jgi:hypothetical protein
MHSANKSGCEADQESYFSFPVVYELPSGRTTRNHKASKTVTQRIALSLCQLSRTSESDSLSCSRHTTTPLRRMKGSQS